MKNSFRELFVWQASVELATLMIALADRLTAARHFALANQIVRAAVSVPSNIAEGEGRLTNRDRRHYLAQARGSLYELETQLEILKRANIESDIEPARTLAAKISKGLTKMITSRDESL
ncbi:MAG TPA: four helix bundle protein [Thermoanaerobaculia bacterium]|nr:four helix bundle protein [Thermoanaerobaculia bacterium]